MMDFKNFPVVKIEHHHNSNKVIGKYPDVLKSIVDEGAMAEACEEIFLWRDYEETALHSLDAIAKSLNIKNIYYKDESTRLGLGSFKALGGAYGVQKFLQETLSKKTGKVVSLADIRCGTYRDLLSEITVVTATDGNHGRSVAW
ncbi:MAG: pyridoxal-phosphate dependent enzyme, partial [Kordiimonas sp.]